MDIRIAGCRQQVLGSNPSSGSHFSVFSAPQWARESQLARQDTEALLADGLGPPQSGVPISPKHLGWKNGRMLVVRGTKKLRDRVKASVTGEATSTGILGDWFATALFWRPQVALVVNARTFLPIFMPLAPAPKLLDRLPDEIARVLDLHGVDHSVIDAERAHMADVSFSPTNDRSVVGVMNEFAFLGEHFFRGDLTALTLRMAKTPVGPLRSTHHFPDLALSALLADSVGDPTDSDQWATIIPFPGR